MGSSMILIKGIALRGESVLLQGKVVSSGKPVKAGMSQSKVAPSRLIGEALE